MNLFLIAYFYSTIIFATTAARVIIKCCEMERFIRAAVAQPILVVTGVNLARPFNVSMVEPAIRKTTENIVVCVRRDLMDLFVSSTGVEITAKITADVILKQLKDQLVNAVTCFRAKDAKLIEDHVRIAPLCFPIAI